VLGGLTGLTDWILTDWIRPGPLIGLIGQISLMDLITLIALVHWISLIDWTWLIEPGRGLARRRKTGVCSAL
jgi:hypothetical protein